MARPLRLEFPGAVYHITSRGNGGNDVFLDDHDRQQFLEILADTIDRFNWLCHAYCLMDNHYHLLIETPDPNLSLGMRQLNGVYTQKFNRRYKRSGHVFQGRFKSILVEKDSHLLELCRYIVLNPARAGMVKNHEQWKWSSYKATAGKSKAPDFLSIDWILGQFSKKKIEAKKRYKNFVGEGVVAKSPWQMLKGQVFFGSTKFIDKMKELLNEKKEIKEIPREQRYLNRPLLSSLFEKIDGKQIRNEQIAKAHISHGYTMKEIADTLGIHYTTVSKVICQQRARK